LVSLVLSVAAISGGSLLLPVLWTLFSKKQNATSILVVSLVSLTVGLFFKFVTPFLFDFSLSRAEEMSLGVGLPTLLLALFEWIVFRKKTQDKQYSEYQRWYEVRVLTEQQVSSEISASSASQNTFALRAIAISFALTGLSIAGLGINGGKGVGVIVGIGLVIVALGAWVGWSVRTQVAGRVHNPGNVKNEG